MRLFSGTVRLMRLALRRDRIKLPLWILGIVAMVAVTVPALEETYSSPQARAVYAATMQSSLMGRAYGGIIDGDSLGAIAMIEVYLFTAVLIAFMSTTLVIRHTRQNEEAGSAELIGSARVGRYASLTAALLVAVAVNALIGVLSGGILSQFDALPVLGSWGLGFAFTAVGVTFAAIAGICAQLTDSSRSANSLAGAAIAGAFLTRAIGDTYGTVEGATVVSRWPSWLSPFGWGQQLHPFTQQNWWVFWLFLGTSLLCVVSAYLVLSRRDIGRGVIPARKGPSRASRWLCSPVGLAWRLQRSTLAWWLLSVALLGGIVGAMTTEVSALLDSADVIKQYVYALGGEGALIEAFLSSMIGMIAMTLTAYINQSLLKARQEESAGHLEPLLATAVSRRHWLAAHVGITTAGLVTLLVAGGFFTALAYVLTTDGAWSEIPRYIGASLVYLPALLALAGIVIGCLGLFPRAATSVSWLGFVAVFFLGQLGALLKLPEWVMNISPFSHIPLLPTEDIVIRPLVILLAIGGGLTLIGFIAFHNRNIINS